MGGRSRRGLSPLVASIILIAFTIIGGFVVYEYFMSSSESVMAAGEGVIVNANTVYVSNSEKLVYLSGVNGHSGTITITQVKYYMPDGTPQTVDLSQNGGTITVKPGDKFTIDLLLPADAAAATLVYTTDTGETLSSPPVSLS
ncbi:archaellin/type IV pilin N-terminal domain-containing protein [Aeropyrum camini]|uniref:Archaeal Type IV pilin N-terminal domain-containing protein n=1 Tax=Aeropyrum camini SY1 = JCM 12091 TaxID=1198449 RepID=U3TDD1_9CREN|nr:archaellin/type IV pilin N-terminal domain-containing protein [Aeropyrum camini]BAN89983.1 hypothetical protein ACAM_0514 [Aeropyrum camini SY1 = JCM 12091]